MSHCIIIGDPHLGGSLSQGKVGIGSNLNSRIIDQLNLLDWSLDQAIDVSANHIMITGDVFDDVKPPAYLIALFMGWLKKCQANSINVHICIGNHDILRSGFTYSSPLDIIAEADLDGVSIYKDITSICIDNTTITFVPFRDRKSLGASSNSDALSLLKNIITYELAGILPTHKKILIGHLAIEGSIPVGNEIDDLTNELFCPLDMFNGYDDVLMGHIHKPQVMQKSNPHIAHIGSMDVSNFGETDHKKYIMIYDLANNAEPTKRFLPTRSLKKVSIEVPKGTLNSTEYCLSHIERMDDDWKQCVVKVEIALSEPDLLSVNKNAIEKLFFDKGVFHIVSISETKKTMLVKKDNVNSISTKMDIGSAIKQYSDFYIDVELRSSFIDLATEIYNSLKN